MINKKFPYPGQKDKPSQQCIIKKCVCCKTNIPLNLVVPQGVHLGFIKKKTYFRVKCPFCLTEHTYGARQLHFDDVV